MNARPSPPTGPANVRWKSGVIRQLPYEMLLIRSVPSSLDGQENETDPAHPRQFRASLPAANPAASYKHLYPAQVPGQFAPGRYAEVQLAARQKDEPPKPEGKYNSSSERPGEARKDRNSPRLNTS